MDKSNIHKIPTPPKKTSYTFPASYLVIRPEILATNTAIIAKERARKN